MANTETTGPMRTAFSQPLFGWQLSLRQTGNVFRESSNAMEAILNLHFPSGSIVDVNYGLGVFYKSVNRSVVGVDVRTPASVLADNAALPFTDNSFDVGVCDPPYKRGDGKKYEHRYGVAPKTETQVNQLYFAALPELLRVSKQGCVIKVQDGTDGHKFYPRHIEIANWMKDKTGLDPHDIAVVARHRVAGTMAQGEPHFMQQALSYFLIYKWRHKWPFRPVRF